VYAIEDLIEKPSRQEAPSNIAIMGRYILKPSIFQVLETIEKGAGNEYQLTDALRKVCRLEGLLALELKGDRFDIGDKFGYLKAIVELSLQREELQYNLLEYLESVVKRERSSPLRGSLADVQYKKS
jgi:UTP--glucose-1-phosphate uridylyltransferase